MKRKILLILVTIISIFAFLYPATTASAENVFEVKARSAYLMDKRTGEPLYALRENEELPIASMVKIMTALLTFEAVERGDISFEEELTISEEAAGMGGSQMFLDKGLSYPVTDLLKGVIVVSANDACVALSERIDGSESAFVDRMNKRAAELGMSHTVFVNATGLPKAGGHSTAHDVALMLRELTTHDHYFDYSKIWLEEYKHPDGRTTTLTNTNKFVRFYEECDGGKTGFTSEAKFCLAACATRGDTKLISVVIGAEDSKTRFAESKKLFSYGFANYKTEVVLKKGAHAFDAPVRKGASAVVACGAKEDLSVLQKCGDAEIEPQYDIEYYNVSAPVAFGDVVGKCTLRIGDRTYETDLIALEDVRKATLSDRYERILEWWGKRTEVEE